MTELQSRLPDLGPIVGGLAKTTRNGTSPDTTIALVQFRAGQLAGSTYHVVRHAESLREGGDRRTDRGRRGGSPPPARPPPGACREPGRWSRRDGRGTGARCAAPGSAPAARPRSGRCVRWSAAAAPAFPQDSRSRCTRSAPPSPHHVSAGHRGRTPAPPAARRTTRRGDPRREGLFGGGTQQGVLPKPPLERRRRARHGHGPVCRIEDHEPFGRSGHAQLGIGQVVGGSTCCESDAWNSTLLAPSTQSAVPLASPRTVTGTDVPTVLGTDAPTDRKTSRKASCTCGVTRCRVAPLRNRPSSSAPPRTSTALGPWAVATTR